jgi:hypothetical protein
MKPKSTIMAEDRVTRSEFHSVMQTLQSRMNRLEDMMAKQFGLGAASKSSVHHYEFQHQNFGGENSSSHEGSSSRDGMFKPTSIELDEESLENVKDEKEQPRDQIIPEIPESETDPVEDSTHTTNSELAPAENANHSLISTTEPDADSYRPFVKIPQPKNSDSLVKKTHPDLKMILDAVDFVVLKHRWRWKQVANVEDAAAEAETSKCRCRRSRAGQRTGCSRGRADRPVPRHGSGGRPTSRDGRRERRRGRPCSLDESISETCQDEGETVKRRIWKQERRAEYGS